MSPEKKKKLEAAIDNLFAGPRGKAKKSEAAVTVEAPVAAPVVEPVAAPVVESKPAVPAPVAVVTPPVRTAVAEAAPVVAVERTAAVSATSNYDSVQLVIFTIQDQFYGIDVSSVDSIIKMQPITRLPFVPAYNLGLTNLRGKVLPVFSLRRRFGLPDQEACGKNNRIIVTHLDREEVGLMVDAVSEIETVPGEAIEPAPAMVMSVASRYIDGVAKLDDRLVVLLDLEKVVAPSS